MCMQWKPIVCPGYPLIMITLWQGISELTRHIRLPSAHGSSSLIQYVYVTIAVRASATTSREAACPPPGGWVYWWRRSTTLTRTCPQTPAPAFPAVPCKAESLPPLLSTTSSSPVAPELLPTRQLPSLTATESTTWAVSRSVHSFLTTNLSYFCK